MLQDEYSLAKDLYNLDLGLKLLIRNEKSTDNKKTLRKDHTNLQGKLYGDPDVFCNSGKGRQHPGNNNS